MALRQTRDLRHNPIRELCTTILLQPATLAHIEALIAGDEVFAAEFGLKVIPGYLAFPEALEHMRKGLAEGAGPQLVESSHHRPGCR
jgi:hypothetical protein